MSVIKIDTRIAIEKWIAELTEELFRKPAYMRENIIRKSIYKLPVHEMALKRFKELEEDYKNLESEHQDCDCAQRGLF